VYKLIYKNQFAAGFDADQIVGNLAQLLQLKPKTVRLVFLSQRPSVIKILESSAEVEQWRAAFLEAGVHLDVVSMAAADADSIADQIELELELHSLDEELDEEDETPRQLLVKKIIAREEAEDAELAAANAEVAPVPVVAEITGPKKSEAAQQPIPPAAPAVTEKIKTPTVKEKKQSVAKPEKKSTEQAVAAKAAMTPAITSSPLPETITAIPELDVAQAQQGINEPVIKKDAVVTLATEAKTTPELDAKREVNTKTEIDIEAGSKPQSEPDAEPEIATAAISSQSVELEEKTEEKTEDVPADDAHVEVDFHKSSFLWGMLAILLAIALTAATILWLKRPLWQPVTPSAQNEKIVNALATEPLFALAHVDVPRLQQLPDVLQSGAGLTNLPAPDVNFWRKLEESGINIAQQLDQVWISAYRTNNQTQPLWVLTGKFNAEEWRAWLKKNYTIDEDSPQQVVFSSVDENTCEKQPVMMAVIDADRIVLGAPERVAAFRGRLDAGAPADKDLSDWQTISSKQMLSVALFNPAQFSEASTAMALGKLSIDVTPVKGIYLGVAPQLFPPVLKFNAVMVGANQEFINAAEKAIAPLLSNAKNTMVQDWPETLSIYERIKLTKLEQQLQASVFFDEQLQPQLQLWVNSLLARTFAMSDNPTVISEERLDEKPRAFSELPSSTLPDFALNKHLNTAFTAQTSTGPFGVGISSIDATAEGTVITLDVSAFNLPNLGKEADPIQLRILDIVDHQDQSLLSPGSCDATGVRRVAKIDMVYDGAFLDQGQPIHYVGTQGTKKILLPENVNLSSIGAIKGELSYNLPLNVERIKVDLPLAGKVINSHGLELRFLSSGASRLYFQHGGNSEALLQVNALNAEGKVLATTNAMRGVNFLAAGETTSIDVQGSIAAAEVIVASKMEKKKYPFSFGRIQPLEQTFAQEKPAPELLTVAALAALKQDSPPTDVQYPFQAPQQTIVAGPALIAVNQMNIQAQQLSLMADIYLRNQHPLTRQLSAARFFITEVEDSAGNIHSVNFQSPIALEHAGGTWAEGKFQTDPAQPWLRGQLDLRGQDLGVSDVIAFWGKLVFLAASDPIAIQLPFQFGMQWNGADSSFKLARWEAGRLLFDIHGSFPELMAITALDDNGAAVSQAAELRGNLGVNQVELPIEQRPATIEFSIARNQQTAEFPFEIRAQ
jgi:hypothetical protein